MTRSTDWGPDLLEVGSGEGDPYGLKRVLDLLAMVLDRFWVVLIGLELVLSGLDLVLGGLQLSL